MTGTDHELWNLYAEWKRLTDAEGKAINSDCWEELDRCQFAKQDLQARILLATEHAHTECRSTADQRDIREQIRVCANELILLERENQRVLRERLQAMKQEIGQLDHTSRRLRQLHRSYAPAHGPIWNRYS